jgi:hypothetical protein
MTVNPIEVCSHLVRYAPQSAADPQAISETSTRRFALFLQPGARTRQVIQVSAVSAA